MSFEALLLFGSRAIPGFGKLLGRMMPPNLEADFLGRIGIRILETFQIAIAGAFLGVLISLPIAWLSARDVSPVGGFNYFFKALVSLFRTIPDLVWALLFVATVGLGAVAGTLTIMMDTIGFCGRFFAEAMEDAEKEPQEEWFGSLFEMKRPSPSSISCSGFS